MCQPVQLVFRHLHLILLIFCFFLSEILRAFISLCVACTTKINQIYISNKNVEYVYGVWPYFILNNLDCYNLICKKCNKHEQSNTTKLIA